MGAAIGLFSSSVNPNIAVAGVVEKQQTAREVFRDMRATTHSYAKNFAMIGMVFSAVECTIETVIDPNTYKTKKYFCVLWIEAANAANLFYLIFFINFFRVAEKVIGKMEHMRVESLAV